MDKATQEHQPDCSVTLGGLHLRNPVMTASGTFGYGREFANLVNLHHLGAVVVKGISLQPMQGNPPPRVIETPCGMLNAIGLENVGLDRFLTEKLPYLAGIETKVVVNILGSTVEEYGELATRLDGVEGVDGLEVNISCPNVHHGGVAFGSDPRMAAAVTRAVRDATRLPVLVKLSPNVTDIKVIARAVADSGADGISLINTLVGMAVDIHSRRPRLGNIIGGLSGPAIRPVALRMVWEVVQAVAVPVVGIGGISSAEDALEFLITGARAVQVGTANFFQPETTAQVIDGIRAYLREQRADSVREIIGTLEVGQ